jgi:hypothetical protein
MSEEADTMPHPKTLDASSRSASSLTALQRFSPGSAVFHPERGEGIVISIDYDERRGKPLLIRFEDGEMHHYNAKSANKLKVIGTPEPHPESAKG